MSVLKGCNNQEIILSNFDFPVENSFGPIPRRDEKQGNFMKSFSVQCQLESLKLLQEHVFWGSCVWYKDQGKGKMHESKLKMLSVVSALICPSMV
jgi:hypothetical protein